MKNKIIFNLAVVLVLAFSPRGHARDFPVEFVEENYRETRASFSYTPLIYHSIQVETAAGPKVLFLTGENPSYRQWLRHYIAQNKSFILKVPDDRVDQFISAALYETDVQSLHPYDKGLWTGTVQTDNQETAILDGRNFLMIVDTNETRSALFETVSQKMGYQSVAFKSAKAALQAFQAQPDKIKMVAVSGSIPDMSTPEFVSRITGLKHTTPVIVSTGYGKETLKKEYEKIFSNLESVYVKRVLLNDLENLIKQLFHSKA